MAMQESEANMINKTDMTQVLSGSDVMERESNAAEGDIPAEALGVDSQLLPGSVGATVNVGGASAGSYQMYPMVIPNSPKFKVPANPLLPEEYSEILDYNAIQYLNGIYRTQIGRFVRVEQLVGSNTLQEYDGYLIGVGINYIILQEYSNNDIRIFDIYGIKNMYVYYGNETRSAE